VPNLSLLFYEKNAKTLSAVMGVLGVPPMQVDDDIQQASASFITPNYFTELGTPAAIGRLFEPKRDGDPAAPPSVVISYGSWRRRFGGDPSVVGRIIHIDKKPATINHGPDLVHFRLHDPHVPTWRDLDVLLIPDVFGGFFRDMVCLDPGG
jgi:hypothetical protein